MITYGAESWSMTERDKKRITALEIDVLRRLYRISRREHIRNERIVETMQKTRQHIWYGHVKRMPNKRLPKQALEWRNRDLLLLEREDDHESSNLKATLRTSRLRNLKEWLGCTFLQLFRVAVQKTKTALITASLRKETAPLEGEDVFKHTLKFTYRIPLS